MASNASRVGGLEAEVVDAPAAPHRGLPIRLGVALDREDVDLGVRADADDRHGLAGLLAVRTGRTDLGVEHLGVEAAEPGDVLRDPGDVVDPVEQHATTLRAAGAERVAGPEVGYAELIPVFRHLQRGARRPGPASAQCRRIGPPQLRAAGSPAMT